MSDQKAKTIGNWATPPTNNNATRTRPLTGRVIFGMLTGGAPVTNSGVVTSTSTTDRRK